jgi:DNA-binding transcriptional MerR regulator
VNTQGFLTVSQLAAACKPTDLLGNFDEDRLKLWTRRLRHWSRLGILPITRRRDEMGSHRLYRAEDVYLAAVLLRLAGPGISHGVLELISSDLQASIKPGGDLHEIWEQAKRQENRDTHYFLLVFISEEGSIVATGAGMLRTGQWLLNVDAVPLDDDQPIMMISLTKIFRNLR